VVLLLVITLVAGVIPVGVAVLVRGVELLPLRAVGNELSQGVELSHQLGDLIVEDALVLFIRSCSQRGQGKL
jgi:hypothetical protein